MKKSISCLILCTSIACLMQVAHADVAPVATKTAATAPAIVNKNLPPDPNINPDIAFKSTYRSKAPVRVYFSYHYLGGRFSQKLNQLSVVNREQLTGQNVLAGFRVAADAVSGRVQIGGNPYNFQTRDTIVGDQILDIVSRAKLENPAINDIPRQLDQAVIAYIDKTPSVKNQQYFEKLTIRPVQWSLVFDDSVGNSESVRYALKFKATVSKNIEGEKDSLFHKAVEKGALCSFSSDLKSLAQWQANDYAEVAALREKIVGQCIQSITASLPVILEEGIPLKVVTIEKRIQGNQNICKDELRQCVGIAKDDVLDRAESVKQCKVEYKECRVENVQPLRDATPVGQCKVSMNICKRKAIEKANLVAPGAKPDRAELTVCAGELKACVKSAQANGDKGKSADDAAEDADD